MRLRSCVLAPAQSGDRKRIAVQNPFGVEYDNGDYIGGMDLALKLGDWTGFKRRRAEAKKRGKCRGIGVGNYVDISTGVPREKAEITVSPEGFVELIIGVTSQGQGTRRASPN